MKRAHPCSTVVVGLLIGTATAPAAMAQRFAMAATDCPLWQKRPDGGFDCVRLRPAAEPTATPADEETTQAIDAALGRWSRSWTFDRYLKGSPAIAERAFYEDNYYVRGSFAFKRMGSSTTIPFGALFQRDGADYRFADLCYEDHDSGMKDCVEGVGGFARRQVAPQDSRRTLAAIAVLGAMAAIASGGAAGARRAHCVTDYSPAEPGMPGYEDKGAGRRGIPFQACY